MDARKKARKIVIVGGVAGGMSAAARARRLSEQSEIIVFERGGYVSFANCGLPYYLGREISEERELILQTPKSLSERFNIDVRLNCEVTAIDTNGKKVTVLDRASRKTYNESYDELILSVGAKPIRPPVPGMDLPGIFTLRNMEDVEAIESWIVKQRPTKVVIAGAGFIGLEMAEQMTRRGFQVTLVDGLKRVLQPLDPEMSGLVEQELIKNGVSLVLGSRIQGFKAPGEIQTVAEEPKGCWVLAGNNLPFPADMVIVGLGVKPEVELARQASVSIGELGGIRVDQYLHTNVPHIWAVGDVIEVKHPVSDNWALIALGGPANRQGRSVADNIFGGQSAFKGSIGTAILRVFDLTVATTGLNEARLKEQEIPYQFVLIHPTQHAGYYPGACRVDLKLLFHKETGKILGAQIVGKEGVDKRIDVIATALAAQMTVRDLADLELAYAPPFGSAKDPINLAGMAASNLLDGFVEQADWQETYKEGTCLLDVRSTSERQNGFIPNSMHIPLPELRRRIAELPPASEILVYCQSGQRSYFAARQLKQMGLSAKNLPGGYLTWRMLSKEDKAESIAIDNLEPPKAIASQR